MLTGGSSNGSEKFLGFDNFTLFNITANRSEEEIHALLTEMTAAARTVLAGELNSEVRTLMEEAVANATVLNAHSAHADLFNAYTHLSRALVLRHTAPDTPDSITHAKEQAPRHTAIYNLKGERVESPLSEKGIFIINNRKVIR